MPGMKSDCPVSGHHQEAVGAETTWDVSQIEPDERSHSSRVEGNVVSRLVLVHLRLQENNAALLMLLVSIKAHLYQSVRSKGFPLSCTQIQVKYLLIRTSYCDIWSLETLSIFRRGEEVMVCGTLLAAAVLQMKSEQAGKAGAASTSCQQAGNRLLKDGDGAACRNQAPSGLERAHRIQIGPRVHGHLTKKEQILLSQQV